MTKTHHRNTLKISRKSTESDEHSTGNNEKDEDKKPKEENVLFRLINKNSCYV